MGDDRAHSRRAFLWGTAAVAPAAVLGAELATAQTRPRRDDLLASGPQPERLTQPHYRPSFFTEAEWRFVCAAVDRLIPRDEHGPGALELGVPQYIDTALQGPYGAGARTYLSGPILKVDPLFGYQSALTPRQQYRMGIPATDAQCRRLYGAAFVDLALERQETVLGRMERGELSDAEFDFKTFFLSFLLKNTVEGYFGDPMYGGNRDMGSWKMIGYPGVRGDFLDVATENKPYPHGPVSLYGREG